MKAALLPLLMPPREQGCCGWTSGHVGFKVQETAVGVGCIFVASDPVGFLLLLDE